MRILVIGASGFTGSLICLELDKNNIPFNIACRNVAQLEELGKTYKNIQNCFHLDISHHNEVKKVLENIDLVINCVGPFILYSKSLLNQCIKYGKIYLDVTGELQFVKNSSSSFAKKNQSGKASVFHSCSFESVLTELGIALLMKEGLLANQIYSFYFFGRGKPSNGTRNTMKLRAYLDDYIVKKGKLRKAAKSDWIYPNNDFGGELMDTAILTPLPEILWMNRNYKAQHAGSYIVLNKMEAAFALPQKKDSMLLNTFKKNPSYSNPTNSDRMKQSFKLIIIVKTASVDYKVCLTGLDPYLITAKLIVRAVRTLQSNYSIRGFHSPGVLFTGQEMSVLKELGIQFTFSQ